MIQFNLLPDIKQQYIKSARLKRTALVVSFLVAASSLFIFIILFLSVHVFQQARIRGINSSIAENTKTLKDTPDLNKVLTIQNQLTSLPNLHEQKPVTSRIFGYLTQVTPASVTIGKVDLDFEAKTMSFGGVTDSISTVNKFVDTLKFTTYTEKQADGTSPTDSTKKPFSAVVLNSFARSDKETTYQISLTFDSAIFDSTKNVALVVPKIISTRSETEKPTELFKALPEVKNQ